MSHFMTELPLVVVKPGKMITSKLKVVAMVLMLLLYVYMVLFLKSFYLKSKRLDRIWEMISETEKKIIEVQNMDQNLAMQIAELNKLYEDY
ncbi:unnamed protein product [Arctia plantaginis]|uniref:Uncharacterized protein n=2 Tax=Arctia plantaginis TaxID=874455 RepID=A0A8S0YWE7_ARCPL|nr:unnamed protein product [Arctia plantaginis]